MVHAITTTLRVIELCLGVTYNAIRLWSVRKKGTTN